jgi:hypothetical protein
MSVFSEIRERSGLQEEHEEMRVHLSPDQNRDLDESAKSASLWLKAGYWSAALMGLALLALSLS